MAADERLLEAELRILLGAHRQGAEQAERNRETSTHPKLKRMVAAGSKANLLQAERLERALSSLGAAPYPHHDAGMQGICDANEAEIAADRHPAARDLVNIAHGQVAAHFYIAKYGTLRAHARALGHREAAKLLGRTLHETYAIDRAFTRLYDHLIGRPASPRYPGESALRATAAMHPGLTMAACLGALAAAAALVAASAPARPE